MTSTRWGPGPAPGARQPRCTTPAECAAIHPPQSQRQSAACAPPRQPRHRRCCHRRSLVQVVRVSRCTEHGVEGLRSTGTKLRRVRLAYGDRASGANPGDDQRVVRRHVVAKERRPVRGANACGVHQVLVRDRQAVQHASRPAAHDDSVVGAGRVCQRLFGDERHAVALTFGFTRSICARCALMTSRADTCLRARRPASSTAVNSHNSCDAFGSAAPLASSPLAPRGNSGPCRPLQPPPWP